jgi:hypothetical protein
VAIGLLIGSLAVAMSLPPAAAAATQIGQAFTPTVGCGASTFIQTTSQGSSYAAPVSGVIASWSYQAGASPPSQLKLKVARAAGGDAFRIVGESGAEAPPASSLKTYPARVPVQAGDVIGFYQASPANCGVSTAGYSGHFDALADPPPSGDPVTFQPLPGFQLAIAATLEPDADGDGFGDETQDLCPTNASTQAACPPASAPSNAFTLGAITRNKKKGTATITVNVPNPGELTASGKGVKASGAAEISKAVNAGQANLTIRAKGKKLKTLNEKGKVKVSVAITYTPTGGDPSTQSRKLKLKKR